MRIRKLSLLGVLLASAVQSSLSDADHATAPEGYTNIGLAAPDPEDKTKIITYVPGLTLLYEIGQHPVMIRRRSNALESRPYRPALTQNGISVLILDEGGSLQTDVKNLHKFDFLVNRAVPVCAWLDKCVALDLWKLFDAGLRGGPSWSTVWARQGGRFLSRQPDDLFWKVEFLDNLEGWVTRYVPAKRGPRSIEDLGYITDLRRPHPLLRFSEARGKYLNTQCNEAIRELRVDDVLTELNAFAELSVSVSAEPQIPLPFAKQLLKFIGVEATVKAEVVASGEVTFKTRKETAVTLSYGADGQSWTTKSVLIERAGETGAALTYKQYGNMLIKKVYHCEGNTTVNMTNANFTIYLGNVGVPIDFDNPLTPLNLHRDSIASLTGLQPSDRFASLTSIRGQEDYDKLMSYLIMKEGLPRGVAAFIVKEINLSPALD